MYELIVAIDNQGGIAKEGKIPWFIPEDLHFFKKKTEHNIIIMGKKTFFSLPKGPLRNRLHIVLTKTPEKYNNINNNNYNVFFTNDIKWIETIKDFTFSYLRENPTKFIIGGAEIYHLFFSQCKTLWITFVKENYDCDVHLQQKSTLLTIINDKNYEIIENNEEKKYCIYKITMSLTVT
jgi:dihydrofolate reductase